MNEIEELKKRIAELEAEVARLKASPQQVIHSHYHYVQPCFPTYLPQPTWAPHFPQITYGGSGLQG